MLLCIGLDGGAMKYPCHPSSPQAVLWVGRREPLTPHERRGPPQVLATSPCYKATWGGPAPHFVFFVASVNTITMYRLLCMLFVAHLATARYYEPQPLNCHSSNVIHYQDQTLKVNDLQVVRVPLPSVDIHVNTVYETSIVPFTSTISSGELGPDQQLVVTEVQLVDETLPLTQVEVRTITRNVIETEINSFTRTATNFITDVQTVPALTTLRITVTQPQTQFIEVTETIAVTEFSTVKEVKTELQTQIDVVRIPQTAVVSTFTVNEVENFTNIHSLTKMITQTVCPPNAI
ncbi:hypothetical protein Pcinc_040297 [Petrolisthes cinctipes]|uniref:Uncharacterized protein n=1 Tax=Petrolisthes cinctipes TaxID=88211 RepID=A0AAE1BPF8_PETCI|nr:hypothetical protein Pcinc_040297 [Petrolisthes cinctipes]